MLPPPLIRLPLAKAFSHLLVGIALLSLTSCVYFNTYYNANKAYDQALRLREKRLDKSPDDSLLAASDEKLKYERCITKCSKVLELYPNEKKWQPKAVFLMAESYWRMGEWAKAVGKYDELLRYFPQDPNVPKAEVHRALCLFENGQYPAARSALERVLGQPLDDELKTEALLGLARLTGADDTPLASLDVYEKLLKESAKSPEARAHAHFAAAQLAYDLKQWDRARNHAIAPEIASLPTSKRLFCGLMAVDCLYQKGEHQNGIDELKAMTKVKAFRDSLPLLKLRLGQGELALKHQAVGFEWMEQAVKGAPRTAVASEAWYRRGDYHLQELHQELPARTAFDSSASQGDFPFGRLAREKSDALARLAEFRHDTSNTDIESPHRREFMMAELFFFRLDEIDSALTRLDRIADDTVKVDSAFTRRAAYARAFIREEFQQNKNVADSLYRLVMTRYPNSDYAQQAEKNLGLKPTVQTQEDRAHRAFLAAEALRFGGEDLVAKVLPAYQAVTDSFPRTHSAAQAQFVVAMVYEDLAHQVPPQAGSLDSAKSAFQRLREDYPRSAFGNMAEEKLSAAGIAPRAHKSNLHPAANTASSAPNSGSKPPTGIPEKGPNPAVSNNSTKPVDSTATQKIETMPSHGSEASYPGQEGTPGRPVPPEGNVSNSVPADTTNPAEGKSKEVLEPDYDNVDQY